MARLIQIHLHQLSDLTCYQLSDRKTQVAERKSEVAFLRNQLLSQSFELSVSDQQVVRTNFGISVLIRVIVKISTPWPRASKFRI